MALESLTSSRADGKITTEDVQSALEKITPPKTGSKEYSESVRVISTDKARKTIAKRLAQSWSSTPHIFVTVIVDMTNAVKFRKDNPILDISLTI